MSFLYLILEPSFIEFERTDWNVMEENGAPNNDKVFVVRRGNLDIVSKVSFNIMEATKSNQSQKHFATEGDDFIGNSGTIVFGLREVGSVRQNTFEFAILYKSISVHIYTYVCIYILYISPGSISQ